MAFWTTLAFISVSCLVLTEAQLPKRNNTICDAGYNSTFKIQCLCDRDPKHEIIRSADCYITADNLNPDDLYWDQFSAIKNVTKLTLTNVRGKALKYIPTRGLQHTNVLVKIDVKYNTIPRIESYAFANLTHLKEILMRDNKIEVLGTNAFAHLRKLTTIVLDKNNILEINRDVFVDLPKLDKLYLTNNMITTIHDRAFVNLNSLTVLEIDNNGLFSLNSETFSGLRNLEILDLSGNNLEVIGDNTFLPLENLLSLNLEGNKIQMLDDKAFYGLEKLQTLTLANNKLVSIDSGRVFEVLKELSALSLRDNQLRELKAEVMAPILSNFYAVNSTLDVEDNNFPCDCRLDWFAMLMNKTKNKNLKIALENLKCMPDTKTKELYTKAAEFEKSQAIEDEQTQNADYEYYDDTQLNGKLFYIDLRTLLNCTEPAKSAKPPKESRNVKRNNTSVVNRILNNELLDSHAKRGTTTEVTTTARKIAADPNNLSANDKPNLYTTSRLATVSAKPLSEKKSYDDHEMAADEAKSDAFRDESNLEKENMPGSAQHNLACTTMLAATVLVFRLFN